jgi:histidyl-tRNA synthetase
MSYKIIVARYNEPIEWLKSEMTHCVILNKGIPLKLENEVKEKQLEAERLEAKKIADELKALNVRVDFDDTDEGMGKKIRAGKVNKVPYMLVIGDKEIESGQYL